MGRSWKSLDAPRGRESIAPGINKNIVDIAQIGFGNDKVLGLDYQGGLGGYATRITIVRNGLPKKTKAEVNWIGKYILREVKVRTPYKTGKLRAGWKKSEAKYSGSAYGVEIYNQVYYTRFVEEGTVFREGKHMLKLAMASAEAHMVPGAMGRIMNRLGEGK